MDIYAMMAAKVQQLVGKRHGQQGFRTCKKRPVVPGTTAAETQRALFIESTDEGRANDL